MSAKTKKAPGGTDAKGRNVAGDYGKQSKQEGQAPTGIQKRAVAYVRNGFALVPIPKGKKGPIKPGWNKRENCITTEQEARRVPDGNIGLAHAYSNLPTCALDVDDSAKAIPYLKQHGIDLAELLLADCAVRIDSGRPGRDKLLFRLEHPLPTVQIKEGGLELRCATKNGLTVQDVLPPSIHPDTGKPYELVGNIAALPPIPPDLLAFWQSRLQAPQVSRTHDAATDGAVCEGGRNDYLSRKAFGLRKDGLSVEQIEEILHPLNRTACAPPLPDEEVRAIARGKQNIAAEDFRDDEDQLVTELAKLPLLEYEKRRPDAAKELGCRASVLDKLVEAERAKTNDDDGDGSGASVLFPEVTPWPEPVDGAELLDEMAELFKRHAILPRHAEDAISLWVCFTHAIDAVEVAPVLGIVSPEKRCGKTTALSLIAKLVRRPLPASNISAAALFRSVEMWAPTLLIDEADTFLRESPELNGILNSGHTKTTAYVIRTVGDDHEPRRFSTWGAKAIACIGGLSSTLLDRSILIELRRKLPGEQTEKLRHADSRQFDRVLRRIDRFVADNKAAIRSARPALPEALHDRAADNWEPLLAIADIAGGAWHARARKAALALSGAQADAKSTNQELLEDIQAIFSATKKDRIATSALIGALCGDDEKRWSTYNRGKPITPKQVAQRLHGFGVISKTIRIDRYETAKGYLLADFTDAFGRYLPVTPSASVTPPQASIDADLGVTTSICMTTPKQAAVTPRTAPDKARGGVTGKRGVTSEKGAITDDDLLN